MLNNYLKLSEIIQDDNGYSGVPMIIFWQYGTVVSNPFVGNFSTMHCKLLK